MGYKLLIRDDLEYMIDSSRVEWNLFSGRNYDKGTNVS